MVGRRLLTHVAIVGSTCRTGIRSKCLSMMQRRSYHVAVVGSGPGAFYTTKYLFKGANAAKVHMFIDMFEKLPTPFGLVRFGVAPDHPEVKNVINDFTVVAKSPNFRFFGNVEVGAHALPLSLLRQHYDSVIVCTGAQGEKLLDIPGKHLEGIVGAPAFVRWYNCHPDFIGLEMPNPGASAAVIGQGNVALDIARVLVRSPKELFPTDIASHALERISAWQRQGLQTVHVVGRRGFVQAAFTNKELRELTALDDVLAVVDPKELELCQNPASEQELAKSRMKKRSVDILKTMADNFAEKETTSKRIIQLRFLNSPKEFLPDPTGSKVAALRISRTELQGEPGNQRAVLSPSGKHEDIPCGLVFRSVGFDLTEMDGLPMLERRVPHTNGRVDDAAGGLYVAGWLKRGPTGTIASNLADGQETAARVLADFKDRFEGSDSYADPKPVEVAAEAAGPVVSFDNWLKIEAEELRQGRGRGRIADKIANTKEMLRIAGMDDRGRCSQL